MLNFREWRTWVREKPILHRWFIYLVLFRPVIDSFYSLKRVSPFLSPLYLAAVLTYIFAILAILIGPKKRGNIFADKIFFIWLILGIVPILFMISTIHDTLSQLDILFRFTTSFLLFFFLRRFIQEREDLVRLLQTFIYSVLFIYVMFLYEIFWGPLQTIKSRGFERYIGVFADNFNYSMAITLGLLIFSWFYFNKDEFKIANRSFAIFIIFELFFLTRVVHLATWSIVVFIGMLFLYHSALINSRTFILLLLLGTVFYGKYYDSFSVEYIEPLTRSEVQALSGEGRLTSFGHGRMMRWIDMIPKWQASSLIAQIIGMPIDGKANNNYMFSGRVHNDYLRILFLYGIFGLFSFVTIGFSVLRSSLKFSPHDRFLVVGAVAIFYMLAISSSPLLYPQLQYIIFSIFAYTAIISPEITNE